MKCAECEKEAAYVCKFCGMIICKEHTQKKPFIMSSYDEQNTAPSFIIVEDAAWCGKCHPLGKPITLPELEVKD